MTGSDSTCTPMARLVLFVVCLAIAGTFVAGAHYFAIDLPAQTERQRVHRKNECSSLDIPGVRWCEWFTELDRCG
jgi:hypothetical protein